MRWRELLFQNLWWKLLAFLLAVMIWSGAQKFEVRPFVNPLNLGETRTFLDIPIRGMGAPDHLRPVRFNPATARVEVEGPAGLMQRLRGDDVLVFVELLPGAPVGRTEVRLPRGIKLIEVHPAHVDIQALP